MYAIAAQRAGMSYGKYMAMHNYHPPIQPDTEDVKAQEPPKPEPVLRSCAHCGKMFHVDNLKRKYCTPECAEAAARKREKEANDRKMEKAGIDVRKVCPICGKQFRPDKKHRKLCSAECVAESVKRIDARSKAKRKNR